MSDESRLERTTHCIADGDARSMPLLADASVDLVVTSPPYPMIEMWDGAFAAMAPEVAALLEAGNGMEAFERMHCQLDCAWEQCFRVLRPGGIACINIGDATRTLAGDFRLYPNHSRITQAACRIGFTTLPDILWRKPTNAPTKFLGSGMLPAGAYVTYEHEYVLVLRKGGRREFAHPEEKRRRRRSAFFWEERNSWFSDVWLDLRGASQELVDPDTRKRSAAFPFELPWRLIQMHSALGDVVLDPFLGTGTTAAAAAASGRSSVGLETDAALRLAAARALLGAAGIGQERARARITAHRKFIEEREAAGRPAKHRSVPYGFPVVTAQETDLEIPWPARIHEVGPGRFEVEVSSDLGSLVGAVQGELTLPDRA